MGDDSRDSNLKNLTDELHITKSIFRNYSLQLYADSVKPNEGRKVISSSHKIFPINFNCRGFKANNDNEGRLENQYIKIDKCG
jgi:hypothetical protein